MNELVSVIVPVYNAENYIEKCIKSIISQTYSNLEIIVIDDGSNDGTGAICDFLSDSDERIHVIHKENGGSTSARNKGLEIASGEYIGFVDGDDYIEQGMFEDLLAGCKSNDAQICIGRQFLNKGQTCHVEAKRSISEGVITKESGEMPHHIIYSDDYKFRGISPNLWDKLFDAELIKKHQRIVDEKTKFAEDDLCVYSALLDAEKVVLIDKPVYHYCRREDSVTQKKDEEYFEKITLFYKQMKAVFMKQEQADLLVQKLDRYMVEFIQRGINKNFGFGFGNIMPFYLPPYKTLQELNVHKIALYGAGDVGKDYYHSLKQSGYEISAWADKRGDELSKAGLNTVRPEELGLADFDAVLIAADSEDLMKQMKSTLINEVGIEKEKIISEYPIKFIETLKR